MVINNFQYIMSSNRDRVHEVKLPMPTPNSRSLGVSWDVGNRLLVFPATGKGQDPNAGHGMSMEDKKMCIVSWETTLYSRFFRKLVNESSQAFFNLQKWAQDETKGLSNANLVRISRQYRSIIRDCQEEVDRAIADDQFDNQSQINEMNAQSELLYKLELLWNLVELLLVEKHSGGLILPQLLQWINFHFPLADEKAKDILADLPEKPENHPEFWNVMALFLSQCRKDDAQKLLRLHSGFSSHLSEEDDVSSAVSSESLSSMDELIRKMPVFTPSMSVPDFNYRWKHWRDNVIARIDEGDFSTSESLSFLALLMAGSDDALVTLASKCETWYQFLVAKLLFKLPDIKAHDLGLQAERALDQFGGLSNMNSLDSIILAIMEGDIAELMNELTTNLDNFWFPAHLLDLLHHADILESVQEAPSIDTIQPGPGLREYLLLEYGSCLMTHTSLWQLGALYLDHCPSQGRYRLECFLERISLDSLKKANKVICMASERGITSIVSSVCKVMGMKAMKANKLGTAMSWALRSQDVVFTTYLADKLLKAYLEEGSFTSAGPLIDNLGSSMVVSDRLTFLAKYREFHKLCEETELKKAAKMLHSLMWSRMAPKYFWVTLLIDSIPFLNASGTVLLTSDQTYEIMHCLQELIKDSGLPMKQRMLLEEHEPQIRLHLSQNLALALIQESECLE